MDINKIEDVIFPHKKINWDSNWSTEILPILQGYANFWGKEVTPATSIKEIEDGESRLNAQLPDDLKTFYLRFGNAQLWEELLPVAAMDYLTATWDQSFFQNYSEAERNEIFKLIIFADHLGSGNFWCFHKDTKHIFITTMRRNPMSVRCFVTSANIYNACLFSLREKWVSM